jgi:hypothetical protein
MKSSIVSAIVLLCATVAGAMAYPRLVPQKPYDLSGFVIVESKGPFMNFYLCEQSSEARTAGGGELSLDIDSSTPQMVGEIRHMQGKRVTVSGVARSATALLVKQITLAREPAPTTTPLKGHKLLVKGARISGRQLLISFMQNPHSQTKHIVVKSELALTETTPQRYTVWVEDITPGLDTAAPESESSLYRIDIAEKFGEEPRDLMVVSRDGKSIHCPWKY